MRLAIFGATGVVGSELLTQALAAGHEVRALVRDPKLTADQRHLTIVRGDVLDPADAGQTIRGCDAVLSTLGATHRDDPHTRRTGTAHILRAMHDGGVSRIVVMGGFHLRCPGDIGTIGQKLVVPLLRLGRIVIDDTTGMADLVLASDLDWTLLRSPRVVRAAPTAQPRVGTLRLGPWSKATRGDIARVMLGCVTDSAYLRQAPMISR